jgi:MATE family multidrug resistance protein
LRLAWPLILANSFWTLQIAIDRIFLSHLSQKAVAASIFGAALFWTPMVLFQLTCGYATTFVAQYVGAGRKERVGPAVWQALYLAVVFGIAFLALIPAAPWLVHLGGHEADVQELEATYFTILCHSTLPVLILAAATSFFTGRGKNWPVMLANGVGLVVNATLDYGMIFGHWGFAPMGIAGAGWATVLGNWAAALTALVLLFRKAYRQEFATDNWRFDRALCGRLLRFGVPSGLQWALEGVAFTVFILILGRMGTVELAASSITFTLNMLALLPALGIAQAVTTLVGQRLGENRPELAASSTWSGFQIAWLYMAVVAVIYVALPGPLLALFESDADQQIWPKVAELSTVLLRFVAVYTLFDAMNLVFAFALKGAGDTRFVTVAALTVSWPLMVLPTWIAWKSGWGVLLAWTFASGYIITLAMIFLLRFLGGKWKSMRVIESAGAGPGFEDRDGVRLDPARVETARKVEAQVEEAS